ncbi:MAG: ABC transporter ATP-binding protein [Bifidobacterium sp.]|nr:ABC transporter ATP-binding protein [Bifidobacterium sp.]
MQMCTAGISCQAVSKRFGQLTAVSELDLEVEPGEVVGVVGSNGAGKSTTMRMLTGLTTPSEGRVRVLGENPLNPAVRRQMGYLPGDLVVPKGLSGARLVAYYGALSRFNGLGEKAFMQKAHALAKTFDIDLSRTAHTLSKGNRQKVGLIQAFAHDPQALILDEPTSGLDPVMQHVFLEQVRQRAAQGAAVFLSSHVLSEIHACADRIAIMNHGRLVLLTTVEELMAKAAIQVHAVVEAPALPSTVLARWGLRMEDGPHGLRVSGTVPNGDEGELVATLTQAGRILHLTLVPEDIESTVLYLYGDTPEEA